MISGLSERPHLPAINGVGSDDEPEFRLDETTCKDNVIKVLEVMIVSFYYLLFILLKLKKNAKGV